MGYPTKTMSKAKLHCCSPGKWASAAEQEQFVAVHRGPSNVTPKPAWLSPRDTQVVSRENVPSPAAAEGSFLRTQSSCLEQEGPA